MIEAEKANYPIRWMCSILGVSRSTFYDWRRQVATVTAAAARRAELAIEVGKVFAEFKETYGCRRIARVLNNRGHACSVDLVADVMRELGLQAVQPRAYRVTATRGEADDYPPDLLDRDFTSTHPGTRLVGDIAYLRTTQGWLYLATVIDLATRMVVGWQIADHMRTYLVINALEMARLHGHLQPGAIVHHDRETQYASTAYATYCASIGVNLSMGRTRVCWDNAVTESFLATLKNEMYHRQRFATKARARFAVAEYIEVFYKRTRMHSTLGYSTTAQAPSDYRNTAAAA